MTAVETGSDTPEVVQNDARRPRPRWLIPVVAVAAGVVVVGGILAAVLAPMLAPSAAPSDRPGSEQDSTVAVSVIPEPTLVSATRSADGTVATFVWKTADPKKGDSYLWKREGTTEGPQPTDASRVDVPGLTPGVGACIDVVTVRSGRTSTALEACSQ
ncbi:hypothetical protein [Leifsonia poae]|uniref:hypothetical protein n=1 Tax=Leifsonia poae TaxID=110933 RepID=UPI003D66721B